MFKWIKKALFKRKVKKKTVAYIKYLIGVDGFVYIDFGWNDNKDRMANESFTELFFKVHSGQLLDNSVDFIKEECLKNGDKEGFTRFLGNLIVFQQENLQPMMESIITGLQNWGVPKESIKMEAFGAASARIQTNINVVPESELVEEYSVIFSKSDKTLKWSSESVSLLELAEANGIAMDSGCRTGNCGTCVTAVKSGELDYPDKSGVIVESGSCLACIARPTSDIVLDA